MKKFLSVLIAVTIAAAMLTSCTSKSEGTTENNSKPKTSSETAISLKDDFYTAINEEWLSSTEVSEEEPYIRYSKAGTDKVSEFYSSYFDTLQSREDLSEEEQKLLILYEQFLANQTDKNEAVLKEQPY